MWRCCIRFSASTARRLGRTRTPPGVMTSAILASCRLMPMSNTRRRSPSVKMPAIFIRSSQITVRPRFLRVISSSASRNEASALTWGISSPLCMISLTRSSNLRPSAPPGCDSAKSSGVKPRAFSSATASASPITSVAVVLVVGASPSGQASCGTLMHRWMSAALPIELSGLLVMQMRVIRCRFNTGISARISLDSPELEMASTISCGVTMPKSPWLASAG
ncbi:Uncharacterised protein [Acinetobacter baumannii]|nr:Uncharacterised protein [Acinetobacter baumannii]